MSRTQGRWHRARLLILAVVMLQLGAWWIYRRVESTRATNERPAPLAYEAVSGEERGLDAPLVRSDGSPVTLRHQSGAPLLVHFWATWCAPCRAELPKLVQLSREADVRIVLVSVDEGWPVVRHFFNGDVPSEVVRDESSAARRAFNVSTLPDTYLLDGTGRPTTRFHGPRDWSAANVRWELGRLVEGAGRLVR